MKREIITIGENGKVHIPTAPVLWGTERNVY